MSCYPNNTVAQFVTKLPQTIELDGVWDVALTEISFPIHLPNVLPNTCSFTVLSPTLEQVATYTLEWGYYEHIGQLTQKINQTLREYDMSLAPNFSKLKVRIDFGGMFSVKFNDALARMLGFTHTIIYRPRPNSSTRVASKQFDLSPIALPTMYIYCDVLQHVVVGDVMAPLLRIVDVKTANTSVKHQILNPPLYVPLLKKNFDTIEIYIMTDEGLPFPFVAGKLVVVLEFKRRIVDGLL